MNPHPFKILFTFAPLTVWIPVQPQSGQSFVPAYCAELLRT